MHPNAIGRNAEPFRDNQPSSTPVTRDFPEGADSLFEHVTWLYAFFREHVFRDDTLRIIASLWPNRKPDPGTSVVEIGCGPGFYARQLATRFPGISVIGVDWSASQVQWAQRRATNAGLANCTFRRFNALMLPFEDARFQILIASRLFTILPDPYRAVAEMHRVLSSGGRCFVAEPRHAFWASIPLLAMWLLAGMTNPSNGCREPRKAKVFPAAAFEKLFAAHPWKDLRTWSDGRYQYAVCEKA
jgi:ubiquinone/menaquinone biosynthesis C-methylase UbiE